MLPVDPVPECYSEIDIFETPRCGDVSVGLWYPDNNSTSKTKKHGTTVKYEDGNYFCDEFVTYAIEWTSEYIAYYFDDHQVFVADKSMWSNTCGNGDPDAPYNRPMYILLNVSIGSHWSGIPTDDVLPSIMEVDYVRVTGIRD
jgi:beta-glucanase (GH16 family)